MTVKTAIPLLTVLICSAGTSLGGEALFTAKPTATKTAGGKVTIKFAVSRQTDVTVSIEDAEGRIVRRLVAGVLGKNPPPPLVPGLSQSVEWDGKADWKRPAGKGPFKVRVALGLGAKYDKEAIADPMTIDTVLAMATGPDGTLYAVTREGARVPHWGGQRVVALNRDGTFRRTLLPLPANATKEQIKALGGVPVEIGGRTVPMVVHVNQHRTTAFRMRSRAGQVAVTPGGQLLTIHSSGVIALLDATGSKAPPRLVGPKPLPSVPTASFRTLNPYVPERTYLASSSDGKYAYFSGLAPKKGRYGDKKNIVRPYPAVFRVKLPERSPAKPFFGDLAKTGKGEKLLGGAPRGMDTDGKGNLFVCDAANNRVVIVSEADGKFVGSFPAEGAEFVAVNRKTGAVYLLKPSAKDRTAELVKLKSWKDPEQVAALKLMTKIWPPRRLDWQMAVDSSAEPAVLWITNERSPLLRVEDLGAKFGDARKIAGRDIGDGGFVGLSVDHFRADPEVYTRATGTGYRIHFTRYIEKTNKADTFLVRTCATAAGSLVEAGPDGNLYVQGWPRHLYKCDRNGKPLKWDVPYTPKDSKAAKNWPANAIFSRVIMVYMTHTLGIRGDGHLFVFEGHRTANKNGTHALFEYKPSGAGGPEQGGVPIVWGASDSVVGPRFDQQGNIYVAEQTRPVDQLIPEEFAEVVGPAKVGSGWRNGDPKAAIAQMYGSIVKFGPEGGCFKMAFYKPWPGEPKPNPKWKTIEAASWIGQIHDKFSASKIIGAKWAHMGISQINLHYCNCENTRFDVDPYGRVWYPDLGRYRVGVLDTNGNVITTFGSYGNAESRGPESPVVDPKTGKLRPPKPGEKSPFAQPDIAFAWLIGVGATDRHAYMGDSLNRRLLRAKLTYAAEATCNIE
jgi:hypothetical protein